MNQKLCHSIDSLHAKLEHKAADIGALNVLMGLDGFVDNLVHVVDTRANSSEYKRITTIEGFGKRVLSASGLSTNIEFVVYETKLGGNGTNMAVALLEYGTRLSYFGSIGANGRVDPIFQEMAKKCDAVYTLSPPAQTDALEFDDGKLMLGKLSSLTDITWESVKAAFGEAQGFAESVSKSGLLGIENWTMIPHMNQILEGIIRDVFPLLPSPEERPFVFFDLCDPAKRSTSDILKALEYVSGFEAKFRVILGLNHKELFEIASALDIAFTESTPEKELSRQVYERLNIHTLVVHPVREAFAWSVGEFFHVDGPYCEKPVLTTGAGDNFNAGFALCLALGFGADEALTLGVATSGFYVRNGRSPSLCEVRKFLLDWKVGVI